MVETKSQRSTVAPEARGTLGLPQATALIVGSIIGVGIFNLPYSLAGVGPISLVAMAAHHGRRARPGRSVRRAVAAAAGGRRPLRLRPGRLRQRRRVRRTPGRTGSPPGRATPRSSSAGCSTSRSSSTRATRTGGPIVIALVGLWIPAADQPQRRQEHGRGPAVDQRPQVHPAGVHVHRRAVLHQHRQLHALQRQRPATSARSAARWRICLFSYLGVETAAVAAAKVRDPDRNVPQGDHLRHPGQRRRLPAVADRGLRHRPDGRAGDSPRRRTRSP